MSIMSIITMESKVSTLEQLEVEKGKLQLWVMRIAALTLATIMFSVVGVMLVGLFVPNEVVDNNEIFKIIGPAFSTIVGAFVGAFATMMGMKTGEFDPNVKVQQMGTTDHKALAEAHKINAEAESIEVDNEIKMMAAVDKYLDSDDDHGPF